MAEFDKLYFLQLLRDAPERKPLLDEPQYCEYLKTEVFGQLEKNGVLDLLELDLSNVTSMKKQQAAGSRELTAD